MNTLTRRQDLIETWGTTFGRPPAKKLSAQLMEAALAYEAQCARMGSLSKQDLKALERRAAPVHSANASNRKCASSGTHLIREWNGRSYQVVVVDGGYVLDGKTYASLSAIAKHITGAHWSGPRFFGVSG